MKSPKTQSLKAIRGFSLAELLVVIAVIAILAALAIPHVTEVFESSKYNSHKRNAQNIATLYTSARIAGNTFAGSTSVDDIVQQLSVGVVGRKSLSNTVFKLSELSPEELQGAKRFLAYDQGQGLVFYTGAKNAPFAED